MVMPVGRQPVVPIVKEVVVDRLITLAWRVLMVAWVINCSLSTALCRHHRLAQSLRLLARVRITAAPMEEEEVEVVISGVLEVQLLHLGAPVEVVVAKVTRFLDRVEQVALEALAGCCIRFHQILRMRVCREVWVVEEVGALVDP